MAVDTSIIVAVAAPAGSAVGACASVATTFFGQRLQARWSRLAAELDEQEELYRRFVEESVPLFIDALQQPAVDPAKTMRFFFNPGMHPLFDREKTAGRTILLSAWELPSRLVRV